MTSRCERVRVAWGYDKGGARKSFAVQRYDNASIVDFNGSASSLPASLYDLETEVSTSDLVVLAGGGAAPASAMCSPI